MNIKFKKLIIDNFLSFEHAEVDLTEEGYILVEGFNNHPIDSALSNGSGKSALFNALSYALTGETIQGVTRSLNNIYTQGDLSVQLLFEIDGTEYDIIRTRTWAGKGDLRVVVAGEDKSGKGLRESEAVLKELLPNLNSTLIGQVVIIGQGMPHKFSSNTPAKRKEILEQLSQSDYALEDLRARIDKKSEELNSIKLQIMKDKAVSQESLRQKQSQLEDNNQKLNELLLSPTLANDILEAKNNVNKYSTELESLESTLNDILYDIEKNKRESIAIYTEKNNQLKELETEFENINRPVKDKLLELTTNLKITEKKIRDIEEIREICPTCGQPLKGVTKPSIEPYLAEKQLILESLESQKVKDKEQNDLKEERIKGIDTLFEGREGALKEASVKYQNQFKKVNDDKNIFMEKVNAAQLRLKELENEESNFKKFKKLYEDNIKILKEDLALINSKIDSIIIEEDTNECNLQIMSKLTTFIRRDFRGILLEDVLASISEKALEYCKEVFGNEELEIKLDGNNIEIIYDNKPLESLSGGEQQKVDLIIQFAIRAMMQEYTGFTSNILVLDEILDNLDRYGVDAILNFISNRLEDVEAVYIISHHADSLAIGNDKVIRIIKDERGVSSIK